MTNGSITVNANSTTANRGRAVLASSNGSITLDNVAIATAGTNNYGALASSGGSIVLNGGSLNANGIGNAALYVNNNGTIIANDMTIVTSGQNAYGIYALFAGSGAASTINVTGGSIEANNATAILSNNMTLNTTLTNTTVSGNNALLEAINNGVINLNAHQTTLNGAALLDNASSSLSLFDSSTWNISDNSQVTTLVNDASTIHFNQPINGVYKRLTATNYSCNNGIIELNTLLHDSNSPSDLVVINTNGSATGTTNLVIRNTIGAGAATEYFERMDKEYQEYFMDTFNIAAQVIEMPHHCLVIDKSNTIHLFDTIATDDLLVDTTAELIPSTTATNLFQPQSIIKMDETMEQSTFLSFKKG